MLTRQDYVDLAERVRNDPQPFMQSSLQIATKQQPGQLPVVNLELNAPQQKVHQALIAMRQEGKPPRVSVLKARQPGVSTYCSGLAVTTRLFQPYANTITIAHIELAAQGLFKREKFMVDRLPKELRPKMPAAAKNEMTFELLQCADGQINLGSHGIIGYDSGREIWRGMTIHGCHLSEFAFFLRDEKVLTGVLQAVPESPDSYIVIESTANGMGNTFQLEWQRAESGESGFRNVFIGWFELPDAVAFVPPDFKLESDEKDLKKAYALSDAQIQWRRHVLYTKCQGNSDLFDQEYPASPSVAFLVTGRPAFPVAVLRRMHERAGEAPSWTGTLDMTRDKGRSQFVPHSEGHLKVWKWPNPEHFYILGGDPSAGVEGGDFSSAAIFDRNTAEIVATWHGLESPMEFAHTCMDICWFYNEAVMAIEITGGHGFSVMEESKARGYQNFYIWQRTDKIKNTMTNYYGWMTTFATRPLLFDSMHYALNHNEVMIWDPEMIFELMSCRYVSNTRAEGEDHDDRAFSCMIAWRVHLELPMPDTGMLPRLSYLAAQAKALPQGGEHSLSMAHQEVWQEVDAAMQGHTSAPLSQLSSWTTTDDELTSPAEEVYDGDPPGGWY